ncbi:hypothetical protein [Streptomyces abyssomicinicus]|uniref:hypothetical protein n=1 Tax=Streptomyces abyssomicinicus TaxID=574929 RepID=UPI001250816E|nr:hypothetical protein [Streptomyces abyssomicinicus]
MGALRTTLSCAGAAVAVALTPVAGGPHAAPPDAGDDTVVKVAPTAPRPGADVRVTVDRCGGRTGTAASDAFVAEARLTGTGVDGRLTGETRVRSGVRPGAYRVRIRCDGVPDRFAEVRVAGVRTGVAPPTPPAVSPTAPVPAGGGGLARAEAEAKAQEDAEAAAPGAAQTVTGLVLAGVAAAVVVLVPRTARRRRARQR